MTETEYSAPDDNPRPKMAKGPNPKRNYKIALVGCGRIAQKHIRAINWHAERFSTIYLVDPDPDSGHRIKELLHPSLEEKAECFSSLSELLDHQRPDIVAITTPPATHYSLALEALEADCALIIEKPMTLNADEALEIAELAQTKQKPVAIGYIYRFFPLVDLLRQRLQKGHYGRILAADMSIVWGHDQDYYDAAHWRGTWLDEGGVLMNQAIHALDLMNWLIDKKPIRILKGAIERRGHRMEAEDWGHGQILYEDGVQLNLEATTFVEDEDPERVRDVDFTIHCEKADILLQMQRSKLRFRIHRPTKAKSKSGVLTKSAIAGQKRRSFPFAWDHLYYLSSLLVELFKDLPHRSLRRMKNPHTQIYTDFLNTLSTGKPGRVNGHDGIIAIDEIAGIYKSALQGGEALDLPLSAFDLAEMEGFFERDLEEKALKEQERSVSRTQNLERVLAQEELEN